MEEKPKEIPGPKGTTHPKINFWNSEHTVSVIVGILFLAVLIVFLILYLCKPDLNNTVITSLFSLLTALIGFFAGASSVKKRR